MVDPLRVSPGGGGREQSWRILPVPAGSEGVQAALGCQVSPSIPCDFTGDTEWAGWMLGCRGCASLGGFWAYRIISLIVLSCLGGD